MNLKLSINNVMELFHYLTAGTFTSNLLFQSHPRVIPPFGDATKH
jgi:hypothetical protein